MEQYIKPERLWLKNHPEYSEKWIQEKIKEDPSLLGLGELTLRDHERRQVSSGRLDLLLSDPASEMRYEVELQLGSVDESHIIRTIEYWDNERKRYKNYDHTAVIVAEDITSRFLNVISLFNGAIPLIAIQLQAIKLGDYVSLVFTKVLDKVDQGPIDEEEEVREITDRAYWEKRATKEALSLSESILQIAQQLDLQLVFRYLKNYIGISREGYFFRFLAIYPTKNSIRLIVPMLQNHEIDEKLIESSLEYEYRARRKRYRIVITQETMNNNKKLLEEIITIAYAEWIN